MTTATQANKCPFCADDFTYRTTADFILHTDRCGRTRPRLGVPPPPPPYKAEQIYTEAQVQAREAELLKQVIKIHADSYSRGGFRVMIHNMIVDREGGTRA